MPDPKAEFFLKLNDRYSGSLTEVPADAADRVVLVVRPTLYSKH